MSTFMDTLIKTLAQNSHGFTAQSLADAVRESTATAQSPEFLRLPPTGKSCPVTGMKRGTLNILVLPCKENDYKPPVRSFTLRRKGHVKGVRLIDRADLVRYIREHVEPAWHPLIEKRDPSPA